MLSRMTAGIVIVPSNGDQPETPPERDGRIRLEAAAIARAREQIAAGQGIDGDALDAWFVVLEQDENAPFPTAKVAQAPPSSR